jgi:hypothetical protein
MVTLPKGPKYSRGVWFDLGDGSAARLEDVRMISGDVVLFAVLDPTGMPSTARLVRSAQRR